MAFSTGELGSRLSYFSTSPLIPNFFGASWKMLKNVLQSC